MLTKEYIVDGRLYLTTLRKLWFLESRLSGALETEYSILVFVCSWGPLVKAFQHMEAYPKLGLEDTALPSTCCANGDRDREEMPPLLRGGGPSDYQNVTHDQNSRLHMNYTGNKWPKTSKHGLKGHWFTYSCGLGIVSVRAVLETILHHRPIATQLGGSLLNCCARGLTSHGCSSPNIQVPP